MRGTWSVAMVGLMMVGLAGCGGPIDDGSEGLAPESSTAELKNTGGGTGSGPSCSASGNPGCSITCSSNQIAVCSDAICIYVFPGICIPSGAASCSCKTRSVSLFSTSQVGVGSGAVETAR